MYSIGRPQRGWVQRRKVTLPARFAHQKIPAGIFQRLTEAFGALTPIAEMAEIVGPFLLIHHEPAMLSECAADAHDLGAGQNIRTNNSAVAPHKIGVGDGKSPCRVGSDDGPAPRRLDSQTSDSQLPKWKGSFPLPDRRITHLRFPG